MAASLSLLLRATTTHTPKHVCLELTVTLQTNTQMQLQSEHVVTGRALRSAQIAKENVHRVTVSWDGNEGSDCNKSSGMAQHRASLALNCHEPFQTQLT